MEKQTEELKRRHETVIMGRMNSTIEGNEVKQFYYHGGITAYGLLRSFMVSWDRAMSDGMENVEEDD